MKTNVTHITKINEDFFRVTVDIEDKGEIKMSGSVAVPSGATETDMKNIIKDHFTVRDTEESLDYTKAEEIVLTLNGYEF